MSLWPHQIQAIADVEAAIAGGERRICLTSPTGMGKTRIACELISRWLEQGLKVILYTNRRMLVDQTSSVMSKFGIAHGVRAAGWTPAPGEPFQVSSIQTEYSRVIKRSAWLLHDADRVLIDECHLQGGDMAMKLMEAHHEAGAAYVGLTATPLDIGHMYDTLIEAGSVSEGRRCGALLPCHHFGPDEPDTRHIKRQASGEFKDADVRKVIMTSTIFGRVYDWWKRLNPGAQPAIGFAPGVGESIWFCEQFAAKGVRCAHIDGKDCWADGNLYKNSPEAREDILAGSKDGRYKVLWNRFVLREGIDAPWLYHGIFATVFGSLQSYLQSAGRLLRAYPGLDRVLCQDHGGNWWRHGSINADRKWQLGEQNRIVTELREERLRDKKEPEPIRCPQCGQIRAQGPKCPACGFEVLTKSRPVIQQDGTIKEHTGDIFKPKRVALKNDTFELWKRMYYRGKRAGMTFRQMEALFWVEQHYYPPRDLPMMPANDQDWFRKAQDVPVEALTT